MPPCPHALPPPPPQLCALQEDAARGWGAQAREAERAALETARADEWRRRVRHFRRAAARRAMIGSRRRAQALELDTERSLSAAWAADLEPVPPTHTPTAAPAPFAIPGPHSKPPHGMIDDGSIATHYDQLTA